MVFEVALGVFLGIVLAVVVLRFWRQLALASAAVALIALLAVIGLLIWLNLEKAAAFSGVIAMVAVVFGIPFWAYGWISKAYPGLRLLVKGEPPWSSAAWFPVRLLLLLLVAVAIGSLGLGTLFGGLSLLEYLGALDAGIIARGK